MANATTASQVIRSDANTAVAAAKISRAVYVGWRFHRGAGGHELTAELRDRLDMDIEIPWTVDGQRPDTETDRKQKEGAHKGERPVPA